MDFDERSLCIACIPNLSGVEKIDVCASSLTFHDLCSATGSIMLTGDYHRRIIDIDVAKTLSIFRCTREWLVHVQHAHIVYFHDITYPPLLRFADNPPYALFYKGTLPDPNTAAIAIISDNSKHWTSMVAAYSIAREIGAMNVCMVIGSGSSVDASVQRAAQDACSPLVIVLDKGVEVLHRAKRDTIIEHSGCIVSEYPPYHTRNRITVRTSRRIISGMVPTVLVIHAFGGSWCYDDATVALHEGKEIFIHPSGLSQKYASGSHALYIDGALAVRNYRQLQSLSVWRYPKAGHCGCNEGQTDHFNDIIGLWNRSANSTTTH